MAMLAMLFATTILHIWFMRGSERFNVIRMACLVLQVPGVTDALI